MHMDISNAPELSPLGKSSQYKNQYEPTLLFPIPRISKRKEIGLHGSLPEFFKLVVA